MVLALICSAGDVAAELRKTAVGRDDVDWRVVRDSADALRAAREVVPDIVLVDRDLPAAGSLVQSMRRDRKTRHASIVLVARGDFDPVEAEIMDLGANAVLRLPPDAEWDARLLKLMAVPRRRALRLPVVFEVETRPAGGVDVVVGLVLDLSIHGLLVECHRGLDVGVDVDLRFRLPGTGAPISGTGRVARIAGPNRFGIEFYGLEADGEQRVREHVESSASGS